MDRQLGVGKLVLNAAWAQGLGSSAMFRADCGQGVGLGHLAVDGQRRLGRSRLFVQPASKVNVGLKGDGLFRANPIRPSAVGVQHFLQRHLAGKRGHPVRQLGAQQRN